MKIILAVGDSRPYLKLLKEENQKNVLVSFAYFNRVNKYRDISNDWWPEFLMLDSGAFSVWTKGDCVNLDDYADYLKKMRITAPETTKIINVNLDVLPGKFGQMPTAEEREQSAIQGARNAEYLANKGLNVIPVFHQHEDLRFLKDMMSQYEYFGISPANDVHITQKEKWLKKVFHIVKANRKTHGFGCTASQLLKQFPFYSADSSSWTSGARYDRVSTRIGNFRTKSKEEFLAHWDSLYIKDSTISTSYLTKSREQIKFYHGQEKFITELWKIKGITWEN